MSSPAETPAPPIPGRTFRLGKIGASCSAAAVLAILSLLIFRPG